MLMIIRLDLRHVIVEEEEEEEDNQHFEDWRETYSHHLMLKGILAIDDENQEELNKVIHAMDSQMCNRL